MSLPVPNRHGVYDKEDAESFRYEDRYLWVEGHVIQCETYRWIGVASYNVKVIPESSGTMGCHSPLSSSRYNPAVGSRAEAVEVMRSQIHLFIQTGLSERQSKVALRSWQRVRQWATNIEKQLDLFN